MTSSSPNPTRICVFCGSSPGASPSHVAAARALAHSMHTQSIHLVYGGGTTGLMGAIARTLVKLSGKDAVTGVIPSSLLGQERPGEAQMKTLKGKGKEKEKEKKLPGNWRRRIGMTGSGGEKSSGKGGQGTNKDETAKLLLDEEYGHVLIAEDLQARKKKMMELVRDGGPGSGFVALSGGTGTIDELFEMVSWNQMGVHSKGVCVLNVDGFWDGVLDWIEKAIEEEFVREKGRPILGNVREVGDVVGWLRVYDEDRAKERNKKTAGSGKS
ncbi:MAG: hypothetical protein Q9224_006815 [Gallowayella concinna]